MRYLAAVRLFILDGLWQKRSRNIKGPQNCIKFVQCLVSVCDVDCQII